MSAAHYTAKAAANAAYAADAANDAANDAAHATDAVYYATQALYLGEPE